jgi:hypothetical protein
VACGGSSGDDNLRGAVTADEPLALVLRGGDCRICLEPMSSRDLKESCVCCFMTVHQVCLAEQLNDADWSAIKDRSAVELCVLLRMHRRTFHGGEFARLASPGNGGGVCQLRVGWGRLHEREG